MINFRWANIDDLDLLVSLRIRDLKMFSNQEISESTKIKIKNYYQTGINNSTCFTLLGFNDELLVATGTLYLYSIMPSNENQLGIMGQLTNIWVEEKYRHMGIASGMIKELLNKVKGKCSAVCLNSSDNAVDFYQKLGFEKKERYMIKKLG